ncbi:hypothetical protein CR513_46717, partial [Mucuna pruriens]
MVRLLLLVWSTRRQVTFLAKLITMKYKGKGNIKEYIIEMSNFTAKLKSLKLEIAKDLHTLGNSK